MNRMFFTVAATFLLTLAGCDEKVEEVHDIEYFRTHFDEFKAQLIKCAKNPGANGGAMPSGNCYNAHRTFTLGLQQYGFTDEQRKILAAAFAGKDVNGQ